MYYITTKVQKRHRVSDPSPPPEITDWVELEDSQGNKLKFFIRRVSASNLNMILFDDPDRNFKITRKSLDDGDVYDD